MALTRIEIEQLEGDRWFAEIEAGPGMAVHRQRLAAQSFDELMSGIEMAYRGLTGEAEEPRRRRRPATEF